MRNTGFAQPEISRGSGKGRPAEGGGRRFGGPGGFTLTELLTVSGVIIAAALIFLPVLSSAREHEKSAECLNNLRQCGAALLAYANDYDGWIPPQSLSPLHGYTGVRRRWATFLMTLEYLEGDWEDNITLRGANAARCPAWEYSSSYDSTYGMRTSYDRAFADIEEEPATRFVRLAEVPDHASKIWLADSLDGRRNRQTHHFGGGFNWPEDQNQTNIHLVHTRHGGKANVWFLDGRAEPCGVFDLRRLASDSIRYYDAEGDLASF